ncbi:MAG: Stk1 family PASTA domain-containing Ser/Thr kinase [Oscillospiraceae bacterium]|jgi:serine/threonine-protein kinase|nr:Stk1 family PASTA domain-containing Ser/Thr kinase [Oscillospiraceae bacterium]
MDKYIGKMLDNRYEILEIMGIGGMAYVYKARCHLLNRLVAVKILKEEYASDDDFRRRFHAESQAVAMLGHPNIVAVYDVSRSPELEYIVMELIDGITLKQYMQKKGLLSWREALHFVIQIVKALSHAHSRGIIHRDIKPHNIMILRDGSVKVADFGIARFAAKSVSLTQDALGSVHYISPEQARGSHIDARSDLYSVGVVLYEMLTERLPFEGDSPVAVALQHINSLPLTPREVNPEIPEALEVIIIKAMAPKLTQRYASADDMLRDLEEFRKNPSVSFEYDVSQLKTPSDAATDEPTQSLPGGGVRVSGIKLDPRREEEERKRIRREMIAEENHKTRKASNLIAMLFAALGVLGLVAVLGFVIVTLVGSAVEDDEMGEIEIPNFQGKDYTNTFAESLLGEEYNAFSFQFEWESSDVYAVNKIISQDPKPGPRGRSGNEVIEITLTISSGREVVTLEVLAGMGEAEALIWLEENRLRSVVTREHNDDVPRGTVIRSDPGAREQVYLDTTVTLFISLGEDVIEVAMPDLLAPIPVYREEAVTTLGYFNLVAEFIIVPSDEPAGLVLSQSVLPGEMVPEGTVVYLEISEGPLVEPSPSPEPSPTPVVEDPTPPANEDPTPPENEETPGSEESPPPEVRTVTKMILMPTDITGSVSVIVVQEGADGEKTILDEMWSNDDPMPAVTITGYPDDIIRVYVDGEVEYTLAFKEIW